MLGLTPASLNCPNYDPLPVNEDDVDGSDFINVCIESSSTNLCNSKLSTGIESCTNSRWVAMLWNYQKDLQLGEIKCWLILHHYIIQIVKIDRITLGITSLYQTSYLLYRFSSFWWNNIFFKVKKSVPILKPTINRDYLWYLKKNKYNYTGKQAHAFDNKTFNSD